MIIFYISSKQYVVPHVVTPHLKHLVETVQMGGGGGGGGGSQHLFLCRINKNYP